MKTNSEVIQALGFDNIERGCNIKKWFYCNDGDDSRIGNHRILFLKGGSLWHDMLEVRR
jgi:hypothetical protein